MGCNCDSCKRSRANQRMLEKHRIIQELEDIIEENVEDESVKKDIYDKIHTGMY